MGRANEVAALLSDVARSGNVSLFAGTCSKVDGEWKVYRGGLEVNAVWLESASPRSGPCLLAIDSPPAGQSTAYVLGMTHSKAYRGEDIATVTVEGADGFAAIVTTDGNTYSRARYFGHHSPLVGQTVMVIWRGGEAYIVGMLPYAHPESGRGGSTEPVPDIPRGTGQGASSFPAIQFGVWDAGNLTWRKETTRDIRIGPGHDAVWSYGGATRGLADKPPITRVTFTLGRRAQSLALNSPVSLTFYRSDAEQFMRGEEPQTLDGPYEVTIPMNYNGGPLELPVELGEALRAGGSITMKANAAVVFLDSPANGFLKIDWRTK